MKIDFVLEYRKRLDGTLQDLEDQQNNKRETVSVLISTEKIC